MRCHYSSRARVSIVAERSRAWDEVTLAWAANNYCERRSEQALLWEGVSLLNVSTTGGRVHSTGDDPSENCHADEEPTIGEARSLSFGPSGPTELETRNAAVSHCHTVTTLESAPILYLAIPLLSPTRRDSRTRTRNQVRP